MCPAGYLFSPDILSMAVCFLDHFLCQNGHWLLSLNTRAFLFGFFAWNVG